MKIGELRVQYEDYSELRVVMAERELFLAYQERMRRKIMHGVSNERVRGTLEERESTSKYTEGVMEILLTQIQNKIDTYRGIPS